MTCCVCGVCVCVFLHVTLGFFVLRVLMRVGEGVFGCVCFVCCL